MTAKHLTPVLLLLALGAPAASACPEVENPTNPLAYIRRDNNRCEGLRGESPVSSRSGLISIVTGNPDPYPETLNIRLPTQNPINTDDFAIQARRPRYLLDRIDRSSFRRDSNKGLSFVFETTVLDNESRPVPPRSLRALATATLADGRSVHIPVILDRPNGFYTFTFVSPDRIAYPVIEIRRPDGTAALVKQRNNPVSGGRAFSIRWSYGNEPAGTYVFFLRDTNGKPYSYLFEHNPQLL